MRLAKLHSVHPLSWRNETSPSASDQRASISKTQVSYIVPYITFSCAPKSLNGKDLAFFHLRLIIAFDNGYALSTVDAVLDDVVSIKISNSLYR
jgi:hypothetical protein